MAKIKKDWASVERRNEGLLKKIKKLKKASIFFNDLPEKGFMRDSLNGTMKKISECTDSTLRRFSKELNSWLKAIDNEHEEKRKILINKKIEIENELLKREE